MLVELRIDNFAIIQHLELDFHTGLTTFTGETGAGKSIILDAIVAIAGGKVDGSMIRAGAERANVEAIFRLSDANRAAVTALLEPEELVDDPNFVTLSREIRREGRSTARVNGRAVALPLVREVSELLLDIHGQSEHLSLLNVRSHLGLLDRFASDAAQLERWRKVYQRLQEVRRELTTLRQAEQDAEQRGDLLSFQVNEITSASLRPGEEEELRQERDRLANAEHLASLAQQVLALLDEGTPETPSASDLIGQVVSAVNTLARIDASQTGLVEQAETAADLLSTLARDLQAYQENIEFNPRRLEQVEDRLDLIQKIKRKYGGSIEVALAFGEKAAQELENLAHATERIEELEALERGILPELAQVGLALSQKRKEAALRLERGVEAELNDLSMAGARFAVQFRHEPHANGLEIDAPEGEKQRIGFDANGMDQVEFLIAPNMGEGLKPLVKVASGGETSRLMLALKNVLAQADPVSTLIFDEIDQGISGRVGVRVGEKLWRLGNDHQVLVVTHLPQLAAFGDQHFRVRKLVNDGRTSTVVEAMEHENRLDELALMMGAVSDTNRSAAREAIETADKYRQTH